jgi:hypothetical protein
VADLEGEIGGGPARNYLSGAYLAAIFTYWLAN